MQGSGSIGRVTDSKSVGWGFESLLPCHFTRRDEDMEKTISKIMMVGFVSGAFMVHYVVRVMITLLQSSWGAFARVTDNDLVLHGAPIALAVAFFIYASLSPKMRKWAHDVVIETSKVVWPSRKDTTAMTIVVCFFMIMTGIILGIFDFFSSQVIQFIIEMS